MSANVTVGAGWSALARASMGATASSWAMMGTPVCPIASIRAPAPVAWSASLWL